jgi:hypothetical protein
MEYPQGIAPTACTFAQGAVAPQPTLVLVFGFNLMVLDYKRHKQYRDVRRLGQRIIREMLKTPEKQQRSCVFRTSGRG